MAVNQTRSVVIDYGIVRDYRRSFVTDQARSVAVNKYSVVTDKARSIVRDGREALLWTAVRVVRDQRRSVVINKRACVVIAKKGGYGLPRNAVVGKGRSVGENTGSVAANQESVGDDHG